MQCTKLLMLNSRQYTGWCVNHAQHAYMLNNGLNAGTNNNIIMLSLLLKVIIQLVISQVEHKCNYYVNTV